MFDHSDWLSRSGTHLYFTQALAVLFEVISIILIFNMFDHSERLTPDQDNAES